MIRTLAGCMVAGALLCSAPPFAAAQENSFGFIYTPSLSMHDESACCSAAGAWLSVGRLHVEHVVAWDSKWQKLAAEWDIPEATTPETVDGHVLTALWTLRSWQAPRFITRFQGGALRRAHRAHGRVVGLRRRPDGGLSRRAGRPARRISLLAPGSA